MKIKSDFVTNSSSTAYLITNISDEPKTLADFVKENPQIIQEYNTEYGEWCSTITQEQLLESAQSEDMTFSPKEQRYCSFGDEDGTVVGRVFDYMLRDGGRSDSFEWEFFEWLR